MTDPELVYAQIVSRLTARPGVKAGKMFGMPTLMVNGKAFAGMHNVEMVFKLEGQAHARALSMEGAGLFDPSGRGRPMREWVQLSAVHASEWPALAEAACDYVARISPT